MNRFKYIFAGLVTAAAMCITICPGELFAQFPRSNSREFRPSSDLGFGQQEQLPSNAVGTCSNCLKTIRGRQVNRNSCPHCGVKWVNKSPTTSDSPPINSPTPQAPWAGATDSNSPTTISLVILVFLLGGIIFMMLIAAVIFFVVKKSIDDNKRYGKRKQSSSYNRYRGS